MTRGYRAWLFAAALMSVIPLFLTEVLPFTDVPEHLAVMATLRNWSNPAFRIAEHYELALGRSQYLLFHVLGAALSFVVDVDLANRLLLAAVGITQPFALAALLRAFGRDARLAIFAVPLFWNRALVVGFLPFVASMPVLLYALALAVRQLESPTRKRVIGLAALSVILFYLHASAFMLLALIAATLALAASWSNAGPILPRLTTTVRSIAWLAPASILAVSWSAMGRITLRGTSLSDQGEIGHMNAFRAARSFSLWAHDVFRSHADEACAIGYWLAYLVLLALSFRERRGRRETIATLVPLLTTLALYFLVPFRVGAAAMLNVRMAPVLAFFAILPLSIPASSRLAKAAIGLVFVVSLAITANAARESRALVREEVEGVAAFIEQNTYDGARLVHLPFASDSARAHFPPFIHIGAYHRVRHGGVSSYSFSELAHWPLHFRPEAAPPKKKSSFWSMNPCVFRNAEDGPYYDFVLVKGAVDPFRDEPPGPVWRKVGQVKDFSLYAKVAEEQWAPWSTRDRGPCRDRAQPKTTTPYGAAEE